MPDATRIEAIFADCLFRDHEIAEDGRPPTDAVLVAGIVESYGFHRGRLFRHAEEIFEELKDLPEAFMESGGGGMSFLNACNDRNDNQWTGMHRTMGHLFAMGEGIGRVSCMFPRETWIALPGGVPYYLVRDVSEPTGIEPTAWATSYDGEGASQ